MKVSGLLESVHFSQPYFVVPAIDESQSCSTGIFFQKNEEKNSPKAASSHNERPAGPPFASWPLCSIFALSLSPS